MAETFARGRQVGPGELAVIRAHRKPRAGVFIDSGSRAAIREALGANACPFCGETKYKLLAGHMYRAHGHSAAEVREMAGLLKNVPLCTPEVSARYRGDKAGRRLPEAAYMAIKGTRTLSEAAREIQRQKALSIPQTSRARGGRKAGDRRMAANAEKYREIRRLWDEGHNFKQIADVVGMNKNSIARILRRDGVIAEDGRKLRWRQHISQARPISCGDGIRISDAGTASPRD